MSGVSHRHLSLVEVARLIFRTAHPSDQQIGRVFERMKAGALRVHQRGATPRDWTTTEESLAEFMANEMLKRQNTAPRPVATAHTAATPRQGTTTTVSRVSKSVATANAQARPLPHGRTAKGHAALLRADAGADHDMRGVYRGIWRDYFLAVMLRKRIAHRSVNFHRAVLAGQVVVLLTIVGLVLGVRHSFARTPPERIAINRYLAGQTDTFHIERWHPSQATKPGEGLLVEVEYRYTKESKRAIHTRRTFRVVGDEVSEVADE